MSVARVSRSFTVSDFQNVKLDIVDYSIMRTISARVHELCIVYNDWRIVPRDDINMINIVGSRIDYCNSLYATRFQQ